MDIDMELSLNSNDTTTSTSTSQAEISGHEHSQQQEPLTLHASLSSLIKDRMIELNQRVMALERAIANKKIGKLKEDNTPTLPIRVSDIIIP